MDTFFPDSDLVTCFEKLTDYARVLKNAYRLACFVLRETLCRGQHGIEMTLAEIREKTGLTEPTIREHLQTLQTLGVCLSYEVGQGGHKSRVVLLGTPEGHALLGQPEGLPTKNLPASTEPSESLPAKNLLVNQPEENLPAKNCWVPEKNLVAKWPVGYVSSKNFRVPEKNLAVNPSYTHACGSDQIRSESDQISKDQIRSGSEASESVQAEVSEAASKSKVQNEPLIPAGNPATSEPAGFMAEMQVRIERLASMQPTGAMAEIGQAVARYDQQQRQAKATGAPRTVPVATEPQRSPSELQAEIEHLQGIGIDRLVRDLHAQFIVPGQLANPEAFGKNSRYEELRIREMVEDLQAANPRILTLLQRAFEQAHAGGGYSVSTARKNLSKAAGRHGISFAERRDRKAC